jgi:hypothetical protein
MIHKAQMEHIAEILRDSRLKAMPVEFTVQNMADLLAGANKQFDRVRFYRACEQHAMADAYEAKLREIYSNG